MGKTLIIAGLAFFAGIFYLFINGEKTETLNNKIITVSIGEHEFLTEVVSSEEKRARGLGGRESICETCGMLFEFPKTGIHSIWMKDMQFPLDILWILDNQIIYIAKDISHHYRGIINPKNDSNKVLEINAGLVSRYGMKIGDVISIKQ